MRPTLRYSAALALAAAASVCLVPALFAQEVAADPAAIAKADAAQKAADAAIAKRVAAEAVERAKSC